MNYKGRNIDPLLLWDRYVEFPGSLSVDDDTVFLPKVVCPNPEHDTSKRHFQINVTQPTVHCFAYCGISGSYEHAISIIEGCDEREARRIILRNASVRGRVSIRRTSAGRKENSRPAKPADLRYDRFLPAAGLDYLATRGISDSAVAEWELGWDANELRIVIPARDQNNRLRFLIRRATKPRDEPKYLYTEGFPKTSLLFGACHFDLGMVRSRGLVLVEGSLDTIGLSQRGMRNVGAVLGTGISKAQRNIIARMRPPRIYFGFDKDLAGITNIEIAARSLRKYPLFVIRFPKGVSDPQELSTEYDDEEVAKVIYGRSIPLSTWAKRYYPRMLSPNAKRTRRITHG